jgi:hypothetical protein
MKRRDAGTRRFFKEKYRDNRINKDKKKFFLIPVHPVIPVSPFLGGFASLR